MANIGHKAINLSSWWTVERFDTGAAAWVSDTAIPAPAINEISQDRISTAEIVVMADGKVGRIMPNKTYNYEQISFLFDKSMVSTSLINQFNTYINKNTGLKIRTHAGYEFEGYAERVNKIWAFTGKDQEYYLEILFSLIDVDVSGT